MNDRPTYPELLKLFYKHSFPDQLGAPASSVAQAIIYKANDLYFPADWKMSNVELSLLSGEDVSNIGRTRQKVLDVCKIDGVPMFTYVGNKKRKAGKYIINYSLTSTWRQDSVNESSNSRQKEGEIDNDPNSTLRNETKHPPTPLNDITTGIEETDDGGDGGWISPADTEEDWIEYVTDALKPIDVKYPKLDIVEKAKWLVQNNDPVLIEECYDEFMQIPVVKINNRVAFFMAMVEDRGGEVIR